jgi:hypothetical protein
VADFAPCCAAAALLNTSQCVCDKEVLAGGRTAFIRQLIGFAPLGCGFALTGSCPAVNGQLAGRLGGPCPPHRSSCV